MLEKLLERLVEIEKLFEQAIANVNALNGAKLELQRMIDLHKQQNDSNNEQPTA